MPTPFDTPHQITPPGIGGGVLNLLGLNFGLTPDAAANNLATLEKDRQAKQQASLWGPIYKTLAEVKSGNPTWNADKVMAAVLQSEAWMNAQSTPGFNHTEAPKDLLAAVSPMYPAPPTYNTISPNSMLVQTPGPGSADMTPKVVGEGERSTTRVDEFNEPLGVETTPGRFNPNGLGPQAGVQPGATPPGQPTTLPGTYTYGNVDGTVSDTPNVNWALTTETAAQQYPEFNKYRTFYEQAASKWGVPVDMLISQGARESGYWDPEVVAGNRLSTAGATGIAQFMPDTVVALNERWQKSDGASFVPLDPLNPASAIDGQARHMRELIQKYQGDYRAALKAYNRGETRYDRWKDAGGDPALEPTETREYASFITGETPRNIVPHTSGGGSFKKRVESIPLRSPNRSELVSILDEQPGLMFAGRGGQSYILKMFSDLGRAIDPSIAPEIASWNNATKNRLISLRTLVGSLIPSGDKRVAAQVENYLKMWPEDGIITDPVGAAEKGLELFDYVTMQMADRAQVTRQNGYPIQAVKEARMDYLKFNRVRNMLGGDRQHLVQTINDFKANRDVIEVPWTKRAREGIAEYTESWRREIDAAGKMPMGGKGGVVNPASPAKSADPLEGKTATNPKTGEKLIRRNGAWVPVNAAQ